MKDRQPQSTMIYHRAFCALKAITFELEVSSASRNVFAKLKVVNGRDARAVFVSSKFSGLKQFLGLVVIESTIVNWIC